VGILVSSNVRLDLSHSDWNPAGTSRELSCFSTFTKPVPEEIENMHLWTLLVPSAKRRAPTLAKYMNN